MCVRVGGRRCALLLRPLHPINPFLFLFLFLCTARRLHFKYFFIARMHTPQCAPHSNTLTSSPPEPPSLNLPPHARTVTRAARRHVLEQRQANDRDGLGHHRRHPRPRRSRLLDDDMTYTSSSHPN